MAKVISSLLVGIGFDLDKKSIDKVGSGIDSIKSKALRLGGIVAGAFGVKALTNDFASAKDDLGKFAQVFGSTANEINAFGNALRLEGGTLSSFMSEMAGLEKFRSGIKVGDAGFLAQAEKAKIDTTGILEAENALDVFLLLADQFQGMTKQGRINAASALGFDEATIRLLSKGSDAIRLVVAEQKLIRPISQSMLDSAQIYNDEMQKLGDNIGGIADKISTLLLPQINNIVKGMNDWVSANRELINSSLDSFMDRVGDSLVEAGTSLGLLGSGATLAAGGTAVTATASKLGLNTIAKAGRVATKVGGVASKAGGVGLAFTAGYVGGQAISDNLSDQTKNAIGFAVATILSKAGFNDASEAVARQERKQPPIIIKSVIEMDGQVITKKIQTVVGGMADQAIQDLKSTEGG